MTTKCKLAITAEKNVVFGCKEEEFEHLRDVIFKGSEIVKLNEWEIQVNYEPQAFLTRANECWQMHDTLQAHEKLWGAASYSVKKYFLRLGVKLGSAKAKEFVVDTLTDEANIQDIRYGDNELMYYTLEIGWGEALMALDLSVHPYNTTEDGWNYTYEKIEKFVKVLNISNPEFEKSLLVSVLTLPTDTDLQYESYPDGINETFGNEIYTVYHKIY